MLKSTLTPRPSDKRFVRIVKRIIRRFIVYDIFRAAAALAYFFFLSLFPFLMLLGVLIGKLHISQHDITALLATALPADIADIIAVSIAQSHFNGAQALPLSLIFTLFAASGAVRALMRAVNDAYGIEKPRGFVKDNAIALFFTAALGLMLTFCTAILSLSGTPLTLTAQQFNIPSNIVRLLRVGGWCAVVLVAFAVLMQVYCIMPNRKVTFRQALPGAAATTVGFIALSFGFSLYMAWFSNHVAIYGAIGAVMALLLLLFFTGVVLIAGAHINCAAERYV